MNGNQEPRPDPVFEALRSAAVALAALWTAALVAPRAMADEPGPRVYLERQGGPRAEGSLVFDARAGFRFQAAGAGGGSSQAVEPGEVIEFAAPATPPASVPPLFRIEVGETARVSGTLRRVTERAVVLSVPWQPAEIEAVRPGVQSLAQRFGEARALVDSFETLDPSVWTIAGKPRILADPADPGALVLPPGGTSIEHRFEDPFDAGRIDLTFLDDGKVRPGRRWTFGLVFRGPSGPAEARVLLGWEEESLAVESPEGPALAVQRLARGEGWRRLTIRFGADRTEISVDGKELAHGRGPTGPLESIRVATAGGKEESEDDRGGVIGEIQVFRFTQSPSSLEVDPSRDEARLVVGDQLFGEVRQGDRDRVEMIVDDAPVALRWEDLSSLNFKRTPAPGAPVRGALARVWWRSGDDDPARVADFAEGAVEALSDASLTLATPYLGTLTIPRDRLIRLRVFEPGLRLVIDPSAHHLGDEISVTPPLLDPPLPEGGFLERSFELSEVPTGPAFVVLDVVQVVGEASGLPFSEFIRRDELKTYVEVNGKRIDYLNRHITDANESPARIRIAIPDGALAAGRNRLRVVQTGVENNPTWYDDLGVLGVAVEFAGSAVDLQGPDRANSQRP